MGCLCVVGLHERVGGAALLRVFEFGRHFCIARHIRPAHPPFIRGLDPKFPGLRVR